MRWVMLLVVAACGRGATNAPAWPKPHASDGDGGESLAPHARVQVAAQLVEEEPPPPAPPREVPVGAPIGAPVAQSVQPQVGTDDPTAVPVIMTEEVIEVTDDNPDK